MDELPRLPEFPHYLSLEITSTCNLSCIMCPSREKLGRKGSMEASLWQRIVNEASLYPLKEMGIVGYGENLLHPELVEFIDYAKGKNLSLFLVTNGLLLKGELVRNLINSGLDRLIISCDAASSQIYEAVKRGGDYRLLKKNILGFFEERKKIGKKPPAFNFNSYE